MNERLSSGVADIFTGELYNKNDVYGKIRTELNDEQSRIVSTAEQANNYRSKQTGDIPGDRADSKPTTERISGVSQEEKRKDESAESGTNSIKEHPPQKGI